MQCRLFFSVRRSNKSLSSFKLRATKNQNRPIKLLVRPKLEFSVIIQLHSRLNEYKTNFRFYHFNTLLSRMWIIAMEKCKHVQHFFQFLVTETQRASFTKMEGIKNRHSCSFPLLKCWKIWAETKKVPFLCRTEFQSSNPNPGIILIRQKDVFWSTKK